MAKVFAFLSGAGVLGLAIAMSMGVVPDALWIAIVILMWAVMNIVFVTIMATRYEVFGTVCGGLIGFAASMVPLLLLPASGVEQGLYYLACCIVFGVIVGAPSMALVFMAFANPKQGDQPMA